jgi:glyoxylase-like metal-dependent hydrolase (beta-lactamase superfamily II)
VGIEDFAHGPTIIASAHDPAFLDPAVRPENSLYSYMGIRTPNTLQHCSAHDHEPHTSNTELPLGWMILHTPRHTPDEIAIWNTNERMLYIGDTIYEHAAILIMSQGSLADWWTSVESLIQLVSGEDRTSKIPARISTGHITVGKDAKEVLESVQTFVREIINVREPVRRRRMKGMEVFINYQQDRMGFAMDIPERLVEEVRKKIRI